MSLFTGRRRPPAPLIGIRGPERLESREVPDASLLSSAATSRLSGILAAGNGPSDVIGADALGQTILIQSQATNLVSGQTTPPLQTNLFLYTLVDNQLAMVSPTINGQGSPADFGGVVASVPGQQLNALLSEDGGTVVFASAANAGRLDSNFRGDLSRDGGGDDIFSYRRGSGQIDLVSRDYRGQAIGGSARVSNPAVSSDGRYVSFITTMPADRVTNNANFLDDTALPNFVNYNYISGNYFGGLSGNNPGSPDLFVTQPGATPTPVSYDPIRDYRVNTGVGTAFSRYLMHGDVQVDPLGRYMTAGGVGFTVTRTNPALLPGGFYTVVPGNFAFGLFLNQSGTPQFGTDGLWRYSYSPTAGAATATNDPINRVQLLFNSIPPDLNQGTKLVRLGQINNASVARDSGQVMFDYQPIQSAVRPNIASFQFLRTSPVSPDETFVERATATNPATGAPTVVAPELFRYEVSTNKFVMITAASKAATTGAGTVFTYTGGNGDLNLEPGSYGQSFNGTRIVFTSKSGNLVTLAKATTLNPVFVPVTTPPAAFQVYQYDTQDQGGRDNSLATPGTQVDRNPVRLLSYGFDQNAGNYVFGDGESRYPVQISDSLAVGFESAATNLFVTNTEGQQIANGTNIYLWERQAPLGPPRLSLVSQAATGGLANSTANGPPVLSGAFNKLTVFFSTAATNLSETPFTPGLGQQVFFRDFPKFRTNASRTTVFSGGGGVVLLNVLDTLGGIASTRTLTPFGRSWTGEVRVALGDVNGDGVDDVIAGVGAGGGPRVVVINGFTGRVLRDFFAFEPRFTGGVYVAAGDLTGDGLADLIIGAGEGGGPRVQVVNGKTDRVVMDAFVYESTFRGGARVASGDVTGDGRIDLITGAGIGGGPRVTVFDGTRLPALAIYADFFAYEQSARGGVYISAGDYNLDGIADLVTGGGPDGGPRVTIFNGANVQLFSPNLPVRFQDFFAFDSNQRTGARPVLKNIRNGANADIVVGTGGGYPLVRTFDGSRTVSDPNSAEPLQTLNPFTAVTLSGAWVG